MTAASHPTGHNARHPERVDRPSVFGLGIPPLPATYVPRTRLFAALDRGAPKALTLVSAPAGTGKTVAVASWIAAHRAAGPLAWVTLSDAAGGRDALWPLLVEALRRGGLAVAGGTSGHTIPTAAQRNAVARQITAEAERVTVVLDCDLELSKPAAEAIHHLLLACRGSLRLILLSRADPLLPLHLYRLDDALVEIRLADLAFTRDEAKELLARRGVRLPAPVLDSVWERTRGWAAGLQLASMSLANSTDPSVAARDLSGTSGTVAEYLMSEVLDAQTPAARRILLETSIVEVVHAGLAEVLCGPHAPRALGFLARGNAFVEPVPDSTGAYRYHPLFRELLCAQLAFESPAQLPRLHQAAARWYAAQGDMGDAIRSAVAAGDWEAAARYAVDDLAIAEIVGGSALNSARSLFESMPEDAGEAGAAVMRAAVALGTDDLRSAERHLRRASGYPLPADGWPPGAMSAAFLQALLAGAHGDGEATTQAADAAIRMLDTLPSARTETHPEVAATLEATKGAALVWAGRLPDAARCYAAATRGGARPGLERLYADWHGRLALLAAWLGQYRKAARIAEHAHHLQREAELDPALCSASAEVALAWVALETYDLAAARAHLTAADRCTAGDGDIVPSLARALVDARLRRAQGEFEAARELLDEVHKSYPDAPSWIADRLVVEAAVVDAAHGGRTRPVEFAAGMSGPASEEAMLARAHARLASGEDLDRPVPTPNGSAATLPTRVDRWVLESYRRLRRGEGQQAADALSHALRLAAPEQLRRPFREAPPDVRRLFRARRDLAGQHRWLLGDSDAAVSGIPRTDRPAQLTSADVPRPVMVEQLTTKELEVLGHLAELLTTEEIAGVMFVSVNTVRTHVRNILRKLAVSRRNEAIRRARDLEILY